MVMQRRRHLVFGFVVALAVSGCASIEVGSGDGPVGGDAAQLETATTTSVALDASSRPIPGEDAERDEVAEAADPLEALPGSAPDEAVELTEVEEPAEEAYPVRVRIPDIGVDAEIIDLGLNPDGTLEVPEVAEQTGWYTGRSVPGNVGPSVVVGHVSSTRGSAVFARLRDLQAGHTVEIHRSDGLVALFRVSGTTLVLKDEFPTEQVYGSTAQPTLRLVTCGGEFDRSVRSHKGNLIVFAEHLGNYEPISSSQPS